MSVSSSVYCGPFVCCKETLVSVYQEKTGCCQKGCLCFHKPLMDYQKVKFCPQCGSRINTWQVEGTKPKVTPYKIWGDLMPLNHVNVRKEGHAVLVPYEQRGEPRQFRYYMRDYPSVCVSLVGQETQDKEIAWLRDAFAKEIKDLEEAYGQDHVTVSWGLLMWTN